MSKHNTTDDILWGLTRELAIAQIGGPEKFESIKGVFRDLNERHAGETFMDGVVTGLEKVANMFALDPTKAELGVAVSLVAAVEVADELRGK